MEQNRKILKIGLILIIATIMISLGATYYLKLDEPVFLKSYLELDLPVLEDGSFGQVHFELRYITNANDNRVVNYIDFNGIPETYANASEYNHNSFHMFGGQNFVPGEIEGRYSVRTIYVDIDAYQLDNTIDEFHITEATVHFSDNSVMNVDIGDIVLYKYGNTGEHFDFNFNSSSNDGTSRTQGTVKKDITLVKLESPILTYVKDFVEFKIGNVDYREIEGKSFKTGDTIVADAAFTTPDDPELKLYQFMIHPKLTYMDKDGNIFTYRYYNVDYKIHGIEFMEIVDFLRARGDI